ncbi:F0F1 ATP synthase subunit B [Candidatus Peregrinibacteria bacterium]|nr:F0F1 ATP synthase subunit B [Candidatus Peregrinibacteria bacterium]
MELIHKLGIDWKLLIAQIVNFFILLFVLYKFVYRPVLDMLDKRSKTIEKGIADAKESEQRLIHIEKMRETRMAETEKAIGKLLDQAKIDAEAMKKDIVAAAHAQSEDLLRRSRIQMEEEKQKMIQDVKREVTAFIMLATGKLLEREFSSADQKRLADVIASEAKQSL